MQTHDTPEKTYDLERLIFFTDGVFAIVITLLVIDLKPPPNWDRTISGLWASEWRSLLAYLFSFFAAGAYWNSHRRLFARVTRFSSGLVIFNLILLCLIVLLPFAANLIFESGPKGEPFAIWLGLISAIGLAQAVLWAYVALVARIVDAAMAERDRLVLLAAMMVVPIGLGVAAVSAWKAPASSLWLYVLPVLVIANVARRRILAAKAAL
jgi:uncharacterized membrane protein